MSRSATSHYRSEIDGLRAVAVLAVVAYHAGFGVPGGFVGVDVFFVISGFLITSLLRRDLERGSLHLGTFYLRRVRRILPASIVVTVAVLIAGYLRLLPSDLDALGRSAIAHVVCAANIHFYTEATNYFGGAAEQMPLLHMWSLGVEEQFYFVFPLLLWGLSRVPGVRSRVGLLLTLGGLAGLSLWAAVAGVYREPPAAFFLPHARAWELLVGSMLAIVPGWGGPRWLREIVSLAGLAAIALSMAMYSSKTLFPGYAAVPPCVGAALFIWAARGRQDEDAPDFSQAAAGRLLAMRGPVFVGQISYSLYLVHWPVLVFADYWTLTEPTAGRQALAVVASFALAIVSWRFVEKPFRERRVGRSTWVLLGQTAAGLAVIVAAGAVFVRSEGLPSRFPERVARFDAARHLVLPLKKLRPNDVRRDKRPDNLYTIGDTRVPGPASLMLWGDSHASAAMPAFDAFLLSHGLKGRASLYASRSPLLDYSLDTFPAGREQAIAYNRAVFDFIARDRIKTVVLVGYWTRDLNADAATFDAALGRTIAALRGLGVKVYVMLQVPSYDVSVPKALAREAIFKDAGVPWRKTMADYRHDRAKQFELAAKYASDDCVFLDPSPYFARDGELMTAERGRAFYLDAHHLTPQGARATLGPMLEKLLVPSLGTPGEG